MGKREELTNLDLLLRLVQGVAFEEGHQGIKHDAGEGSPERLVEDDLGSGERAQVSRLHL